LGSSTVTGLGHESLGLDDVAHEAGEKVLQEGLMLAKKAGFKVSGQLAEGRPWRAIVDVADNIDAGIIVLGARGLSATSSLLLGSVTMGVIHHTSLPVLVVHEQNKKKNSEAKEKQKSAKK
jgi:nucleotide-binding universal stress UspA family protein